jgi:hypothetical protein
MRRGRDPCRQTIQRRPDPITHSHSTAITIKFNKARAQYLLKCLAAGTPSRPVQQGWSGNDMLALAGACFCGALSQGPPAFGCRDTRADSER